MKNIASYLVGHDFRGSIIENGKTYNVEYSNSGSESFNAKGVSIGHPDFASAENFLEGVATGFLISLGYFNNGETKESGWIRGFSYDTNKGKTLEDIKQ